jgi:hypothetical protein
LLLRLGAVLLIAVVGVFLYSGIRDRLILPQCDSESAKQTLSTVLKELKLEPVRFEPLKTVSRSKDQVVCSALLPLPDGATVAVDYSFYWQGNKASMRYSVSRRTSERSAVSPSPAAADRSRPPSASG